jgi:NAD-dependent deacetylase
VLQARAWLSSASSVVVLTGAGISAESGVPTFRGPGGLWKQYRPEDLATPEAFARDPKLVWEWYDWRRVTLAAAQPNAGHAALVELERRTPQFTLVTQNVDGLHERAGSRNVIRLHGDIWLVRCTACGRETRDERAPLGSLPPRCEACEGLPGCGVVRRAAAARGVEPRGAGRARRRRAPGCGHFGGGVSRRGAGAAGEILRRARD